MTSLSLLAGRTVAILSIPASISTELTTDNTALLVRVISLQPVRRFEQVSGGNVAVVDGESHLLRTCKPCLMFIPLAVCVHVIFVFQTNITVKSF